MPVDSRLALAESKVVGGRCFFWERGGRPNGAIITRAPEMGRSFPSSSFGTRLINSSSWEDSRAALPRYQDPAWLACRVPWKSPSPSLLDWSLAEAAMLSLSIGVCNWGPLYGLGVGTVQLQEQRGNQCEVLLWVGVSRNPPSGYARKGLECVW